MAVLAEQIGRLQKQIVELLESGVFVQLFAFGFGDRNLLQEDLDVPLG
ncbi:MAG: hypothetical protein IPN71_22265 [Fibrobacteres bacterium]|nr:hypothetical protein [Fibrobacterota bacterium]